MIVFNGVGNSSHSGSGEAKKEDAFSRSKPFVDAADCLQEGERGFSAAWPTENKAGTCGFQNCLMPFFEEQRDIPPSPEGVDSPAAGGVGFADSFPVASIGGIGAGLGKSA